MKLSDEFSMEWTASNNNNKVHKQHGYCLLTDTTFSIEFIPFYLHCASFNIFFYFAIAYFSVFIIIYTQHANNKLKPTKKMRNNCIL
jgi:hypothetical protein